MKYVNFKRFKFSTIFKYINLKRYNFSKFVKIVDFKRINFKKISKFNYIITYNFLKFIKKLNLTNTITFKLRKNNFLKSKFLLLHLPASIIFFSFLYLVIPTFYNYNPSDIEKIICKQKNIKCLIKGKVNYRFYPTPRINIKNIEVKNTKNKITLIESDQIIIKLSIKNLLSKDKHTFKKIQLKNYTINFNLKNFKNYKNAFIKKLNFIPLVFDKGKINFFDGKDYVATINNANLNLINKNAYKEADLKGKFLNDDIYISLINKKKENVPFTDVIIKMSNLNLLVKSKSFNSEKDKNLITTNVLIKKDKNRFTAMIDYKDDEIVINKSNLRNFFLDGKLSGKIKFLPYFNFNLDLDLNSLNFTKLYNYFLSLDEKSKTNIFRVNKKINGNLSLSTSKIYSSYNLIKSFESDLKFNNGNIFIEKFLINLGKLGAADLLGSIINDQKFTNFKYESNIFVDNQKKFISKFGIYKKKEIPSNLFISGHFDIKNIRSGFYEISHNEKISDEDINFIEEEFNNFMLEDGYKDLFRFPKFKEFLKSVTSEAN